MPVPAFPRAATIFAALLLVPYAAGQEAPPNAAVAPAAVTPTRVLQELQDAQRTDAAPLVAMADVDFLIREGGGGSCPSAAAFVVMQAARGMIGLDPLERPHRALLAAFRDAPKLLHGRVTNNRLVALMEYLGRHLEGGSLDVGVLSAPNSPHAADDNVWAVAGPPPLEVRAGEIKVLSFTVTEPSGEVLGRHFVILKTVDGGELSVVDPGAPTKVRRYLVEAGDRGCGRAFLRLPPEFRPAPAEAKTFELNTVFTVRVRAAPAPVAATDGVDAVKRRIDATAAALKERGELRSPAAWRAATAGYGLPGLDLPEAAGGSGWSTADTFEVFRHAGRHDLNLRDVVGGAHARVLAKSDDPWVRSVVRDVAAGRAYVAICITEPEFGTDYRNMTTTSRKVEGGYLLNGRKLYNARLAQATHVIVFAKSVSGTPGRTSVYVLSIDADGLTPRTLDAHGLTGNSYGGLDLEDVFVPDGRRIGDDDDGYPIFNEHFAYWRLMQVGAALGCAEQALEQLADRLETRVVYGAKLGRMTHLQQPLGEYETKLRMADALARDAAALLDDGNEEDAARLICGLKAEGVEIALEAVDAATRAFGGEGYSRRVDLGDRYRDLMGLRIADGATDVMRSAVVAKAYGGQFWDMAFDPPAEPAAE